MQPVRSVPLEDTLSTTSTFICPFADCARAHRRRQEVARHITQHLPPSIYCPQPGCNWNGSRRDALRNHLRTKHSGIPVPEEDEFTIYDSKVLIELLVSNVITAEQAMHVAHLEFRQKAEEVGKLGLWRE